MAEGILFNVVGEITMKLSSLAVPKLGMLWGVKDEITKLTNSASSIKAVLLDAEEQRSKSHSMKDWLEKLEDAFYDIEDVIDKFFCEALYREVMTGGKKAKLVRIFFSKSNQVVFSFKMARKIKNVRENLEAIVADRSKFPFIKHLEHVSFDHHIKERENTHSFILEEEVIGRDHDKIIVKNYLLDMNVKPNISFIVIVGMGGIGKTTLAKFLYNDREVSQCFELKLWICVSQLFDVKIVVEKIIESATNSRPDALEMESLQSQLKEVIQGKKYLLVMDDIWNETEEKWFNLKNLLMGGAKGSKIVITKRDSKLATEIANMTLLYNLQALSKESSWLLFRKMAFKEEGFSNNPNMVKLGQEIAQKCKGVPLIIRSIGRLLYFKTSEEEWMSFKDKELSMVTQQENDITFILKLSYDHLPLNLKKCFVYCLLFPKASCLSKDVLIKQWIAQGFVQSSNRSRSLEDIGHDYIMELASRSLIFQHLHYVYPMHDLMRDLAQMVAGNQCRFIDSEVDNVVNEKTHHVSFVVQLNQKGYLPNSLLKAKRLRTLLSYHNYNDRKIELNEAALDKLFSSFVRLRVLKLNGLGIKQVPDSIKKLRQLRYLDLSLNEDLESLPNSITELQNLQTLDLRECFALKELPRDTSNLVNLRHLDIYDSTCLTHMPKGMGKLTCLRTLNLFVLDNNNRQASTLSDLNGLNDLTGWLQISGLGQLRSSPSEASSANLKDKKGLRHLMLEWEGNRDDDEVDAALNDEIVLEGLEPYPNIQSLCIDGYSGVGLSNWVSLLLKLTTIHIVDCTALRHLPPFDQLPNLADLTLEGITALEFIDNKDSFSSSVFFPSLENLWLGNMPNLKGWWKWDTQKHRLLPSFPRLTSIEISNCPMLASMPLRSDLKYVRLCGVSLQTLELPAVSTLRPAGISDASFSNTFSPFANLKSLQLNRINDLEFLPEKLCQHLHNLELLYIEECQNFQASVSQDMRDPTTAGNLPEWIGSLVSLQTLHIIKCPKLKSLPEGMRQLKSLRFLRIVGCPEVQERCEQGGEDWPKIAHVPHYEISS